ncbi:hypothetical protein U9M48_023715 [Paspalum notatum var. saurae]|uniref:Uncharacterized protein n=1 Tax=Paspalum notatum var. saurae TaxID=547442 RepID=A0AAQ3TPZ6_PASNO
MATAPHIPWTQRLFPMASPSPRLQRPPLPTRCSTECLDGEQVVQTAGRCYPFSLLAASQVLYALPKGEIRTWFHSDPILLHARTNPRVICMLIATTGNADIYFEWNRKP